MKKEIPILYSTAMAKAKVEMRKTQTRRIAKNHPGNKYPSDECWYETRCSFEKYYSEDYAGDDKEKALGPTWLILNEDGDLDGFLGNCPYGQPGDLLWGRESVVYRDKHEKYYYKADHTEPFTEPFAHNGWKPSIHMPKEAARIWDEVISVRVERVADISVEDCIAEGIEYWNIDKDAFEGGELVADYKNYTWVDDEKHPEYWSPTFANAKYSYRSLWQLINGKPKAIQQKQNGKLITTSYIVYPFDAEAGKEFEGLTIWKGKPLTVVVNPWVWVIETNQLSVTGKPE